MDLSAVIEELDTLVLEQLTNGRFVCRGPASGWCKGRS